MASPDNNNERQLDLNLLKTKALKILEVFDRFCKEHELTYSVEGGTLLGAVRHKGFIPWDDDIDVMMPRKDYDRFIELTKESFVPGYKVTSPYNNPHHHYYFAKIIDMNTTLIQHPYHKDDIMGVFIDVFPMDAVPRDAALRAKQAREFYKHLNRAYSAFYKEKISDLDGFRLKARRIWLSLFTNRNKELLACNRIAARYDMSECKDVRLFGSIYGDRAIVDKSIFKHLEDMKFEDLTVSGTWKWDYYLTRFHGDFMELPPENRRVSLHKHYFIDLNRRWTEQELKDAGII